MVISHQLLLEPDTDDHPVSHRQTLRPEDGIDGGQGHASHPYNEKGDIVQAVMAVNLQFGESLRVVSRA